MMPFKRLGRTPLKPHVEINVKDMKEDNKEGGESETHLSVRGEFEEGSVTSVDQISICSSENINEDEGDSHSMRTELRIGKDGGTLDIQNTGVSLEIPPGALRRDYCIQMRIIPHHETELSFASNSSVVVELLPNNVKLLKPAILTLPHYLVLKKKCGWKAKVYSSHHKEGTQPQWEEEINTQCDVTYEDCVMPLYNFCWKKVEIDGHIVEAKRIILYAAVRSFIENEIFLDIGYYWQLPSCREVLQLNRAILLHEKPSLFFKDGQLPLTILFEKVVPPHWTCNEGNNVKEISFNTVAITEASFCTFVLNKMASDETDQCTCYFQAGQGSHHVELTFSPMESKLSRTEAIIPSTGNATAGDTHEKLPSAIVQTEEIAVSDESLQYLSENIGKNWRTVGRKLKLTDGQLDILDLNHSSNHQEKVYQMLLVWKRGTPATYDVLADALESAGRADLCREITRNTLEQDVVKNLKEMKEECNKVRDTQTCLSNRREFEEGSCEDYYQNLQVGRPLKQRHSHSYGAYRLRVNHDYDNESVSASLPTQRHRMVDMPIQQFQPYSHFQDSDTYTQYPPLNMTTSSTTQGHHGQRMPAQHLSMLPQSTPLQRYTAVQDVHLMNKESSLSRTEATIPSMGSATASHEELPSAIVQTKDSAVSKESLQDLSVELSNCWKDVGRNLQLTEGQLESLEGKGYVTLKEKIYQMLLVWKRKRGSAATYDVLGDALRKADRVDLQEYLLTTYKPT